DRLAAELDAGAGAGDVAGSGSAPPPGAHKVPRRALLAGAGAVAAGVAGVVLDRALLGGSGNGETPVASGPSGEIEPVDGAWVAVAPASALASGGAQRFSTPSV